MKDTQERDRMLSFDRQIGVKTEAQRAAVEQGETEKAIRIQWEILALRDQRNGNLIN